jgi:DNA-binding NarL/FixJ family response regulator
VVVEAAGDDGFRFIRAGCAGLLRPGIPPEQLQMVLTKVMAGEIWAPPTVLSRVIRHLMRTDNQPFLTSREQQVFELVSSGLRNQDVADALFISRETVRWHMRSIYAKLGKGAVQRIRGPHSASR